MNVQLLIDEIVRQTTVLIVAPPTQTDRVTFYFGQNVVRGATDSEIPGPEGSDEEMTKDDE